MHKTLSFLLVATMLGAPAALWAGPTADAMLGGALGGALGAGVGSELGGREGAILGGALGGAVGTAMTTRRHRRPDVIHVDRPAYRDYGPPSYYRQPGWRRGHYRKHRRDYDD